MKKAKHTLHMEYITGSEYTMETTKMPICSRNVPLCANISHQERKKLCLKHTDTHTSINPIRNTILTPDYLMFTISHTQLSNINAVGPCKVGHVGRQGRVGGQDFDRQIPAEGIHVDVLRPGPNCNL